MGWGWGRGWVGGMLRGSDVSKMEVRLKTTSPGHFLLERKSGARWEIFRKKLLRQ